jgi:glyoxylase-like metal-dependent hydrolase (beta-lactamase superfamily II)/rhodanese-related sulfurtransferase
MILEQFYLGCLSQASYLIGDEETGTAAVVDPRRDVEIYLEEAARKGLTIRHVLLTHFHADYISGHLELRERAGAVIHMGSKADPDFPFEAMADGSTLEFGNVKLQVLETPGHTPESICIVVYDLAKDPDRPHGVLTGDTLFIGDVGRPDLLASVGITAEELAGNLYDSITRKLLALPDETLVYPAHGAGSMCGKNLSSDTVSTIGLQRKLNAALRDMPKEEFIEFVTSEQPRAPAYFSYDATLNRRERVTLEENLAEVLVPRSATETLELVDSGAQLVDVRDPDAFAARHVAGSLNIGLRGNYATFAGTILDRERPIVVLAEPGEEGEAVIRLGRIGFDEVAGYVEGGISAFEDRPGQLRATPRMFCADLERARSGGDRPYLLDIRTERERGEKEIPGSHHLPLDLLPQRLSEIPREGDIVLYCAGGYRSSIGASLLRREGFERVSDLVEGVEGWEARGGELRRPEVPSS